MKSSALQRSFTERDFSALAHALDDIPPRQRELFLTKLVVLLSAAGGGGPTLEDAIRRASQHFPGDQPCPI